MPMASRNPLSNSNSNAQHQARTCLCSPTTHPGSFRCSLHRNLRRFPGRFKVHLPSSKRERVALEKVNSFRAILLQIIKPSSHDLSRRRNFQPRPSRFCLMEGNRDGVVVS
ncbi:hypothetical protein K2173_017715 [Erythroxylum novogranatense]|uniref:Uncharacterized protein n=1 Tax=Erythroxylum novogranatense TaxID=1862640 RepID=A0AAV8SLS6_9ROSI|nr:hypothetical protein K2173_017715 [Erythroxylum novogranatense]